ncbi:MAG: hypothetical protein V4598_17350 [Bdellovibrionota bacterium]
MSMYTIIIFSRVIEIISRFMFLATCLSALTLVEYGEVSYNIALFQYVGLALFAACLPAMTKVPAEKLLSLLTIVALAVFAISYLFFGNSSFIFLFYGFLYILNGWYGVQEKQTLFGILRGVSFVGQLVILRYGFSKITGDAIFLSFGFPALVLLSQYPFKKFRMNFPDKNELKTYLQFQGQGLTFQSTKMTERWIAKLILGEAGFGLYSTFRDLINAVNLTLFSPLYQTKFKKLAEGLDYKKIVRPWIAFWVIGIAVGISLIFVVPSMVQNILNALKIKLSSEDLIYLGFLFGLDFFKAFFLMTLEAKKRLSSMFLLNIADIGIQLAMAAMIFTEFGDYSRMLFLFFGRAVMITAATIWMNKSNESLNP